jgi:DNA helicase-2/ATP-dependent DNA helicase PcrA
MPDPRLLGRCVVVGPGDPVPALWEGVARVGVDRLDAATADRLGAAWRGRQASVIELTPGLGLDDPTTPPPVAVSGSQPWEWAVDVDLVGERLHHALWSNAVDGRQGRCRYRWAQEAVEFGARPGPDGLTGTGEADVVLADGRRVICDGGPLDVRLAASLPVGVVHRTMIEHGHLRPLGLAGSPRPDLAADQLAAVMEPTGSARVIAPAGSGKTRVLTERLRLLLEDWGLPAPAVTAVAFNVRAAEEMRIRLAEVPGVRVRTLNALALRLSGASRTIDTGEVRRRLERLVAFPRRAETDPLAAWIEALSRVRLGMRSPEAVAAELGGELVEGRRLGEVAVAYRAGLAADGVVDFDEQVVRAVERLLAEPGFRQASQRHARMVLVDEFQDLTPAHLLLLRLLVGPAGAVFAVGDDDQTIYGYAGASPRWLVQLDRFFPGAASHALEVNYRCPPAVVTAAARLLRHNQRRIPKTVRAAAAGGSAGEGTSALDALTVRAPVPAPAASTAERVAELAAGGAAPAEVAVLARVHAALVPVQVLLKHRGLPVAAAVDDRFLRRGGVGAALAWLAVAAAPAEALPGPALRAAARRPRRAMSPSLLDLVGRQTSLPGLASLARWLAAKGSEQEAAKVRSLHRDVVAVQRAAADGTEAVLELVRTEVGGGLDVAAGSLDQWSKGAIASHTDDLDALTELAPLEPDPTRFECWLADQLAAPGDPDGVVLASIHAVKGREWRHVILHQVTDGLVPHRLAEDLEEERRIFHVGLTRGRETVTLVGGEPPSRFLPELLPEPGVLAGDERPVAERSGHQRARSHPRAAAPTGGRSHHRLAPPTGGSGFEEAWERFREWRRRRSAADGVPAYVVLGDATLRQVAAVLPTTRAALAAISGIGPVKLERYGSELLELAAELRR